MSAQIYRLPVKPHAVHIEPVRHAANEPSDWRDVYAFLAGSAITWAIVFAALVMLGWRP